MGMPKCLNSARVNFQTCGCAIAPQAFAFKFDTMCVVKEAVEDGIGVGGISGGMMPQRGRKLAGHDGRLAAVPIFQDLEQVVPALCIQGLKIPVVQNE